MGLTKLYPRNCFSPKNLIDVIGHNYIWLSVWAGKMNQILWLATQAGKMVLLRQLEITCCAIRKKNSLKPDTNSPSTKPVRSIKMAGYWYFTCIWTSSLSRSITTRTKNLAIIQPSWPHPWWTAHIYFRRSGWCSIGQNFSLFFLII